MCVCEQHCEQGSQVSNTVTDSIQPNRAKIITNQKLRLTFPYVCVYDIHL